MFLVISGTIAKVSDILTQTFTTNDGKFFSAIIAFALSALVTPPWISAKNYFKKNPNHPFLQPYQRTFLLHDQPQQQTNQHNNPN